MRSGRVLEDSQSLASAGIADGHTLHLVEQDPAHQAAAAAAGGAAAPPGWGGGQPDMLSALLGAGGAPGSIEVRSSSSKTVCLPLAVPHLHATGMHQPCASCGVAFKELPNLAFCRHMCWVPLSWAAPATQPAGS